MCIKKLLLSLILIFALIIFSSCGDIPNDTDSSSDDLEDISTDTTQATDTESDSDDIEILDTDTSQATDSDGDNIDSDIEENTTFGNFSTTQTTIPSADRLKQINLSKQDFNKGSKYTLDQLKSIKLQASIIASDITKLKYPNASELMEHYLKGKGENYELDVEDFLKNETAKKNMLSDVNNALRAVEVLAESGEKCIIYQIEESIHHNLTGDWKYSVGSYFTSIEVSVLEKNDIFGVTYYTAKLKYIVQDFYNWDSKDTNNVSITKVSPAALHELHVNGEAQEFLTYGEEEYTIRWVKGVDSSKINFDND